MKSCTSSYLAFHYSYATRSKACKLKKYQQSKQATLAINCVAVKNSFVCCKISDAFNCLLKRIQLLFKIGQAAAHPFFVLVVTHTNHFAFA
jgi:hypothetical protein